MTTNFFLLNNLGCILSTLRNLIFDIEKRIDQILLNYQEEVQLLITMPGIKKDTAAVIIAEIGVDMSQFPTSKHLASWAGLSPGNHESAGKRKSARTVKGNPHIKSSLCEAAWAVSQSRNKKFYNKYLVISCAKRKEKSTRCHRTSNAYHCLSYASKQRTLP